MSEGYDDLLALALDVAREAADLVRARREAGVSVADTKTSPTDVVTQADYESQELIRRRLLDARPDDGFLGEEGNDREGSSGTTWVVDPIDGTVNYLYGLPHYAVSVAATQAGRSVVGVVVAPVLDLEYAATRGGGATRNGAPLSTRTVPALEQLLVGTGFSYEPAVRAHQAEAVARLLPQVRDVRRIGSCALDLCAVADGSLDAYVEEGPHAWDHAAGGLVAQECGALLEVWPAPRGLDLVVCAPAPVWGPFTDLVRACGFE